MFNSLAQKMVMDTDVLLSIAAFVFFLRSGLRNRYPWVTAYLGLRAATGMLVWGLLYGPLFASPEIYTKAYFVIHWAGYVASSVLLFLSCLDVYRQALAPLKGLVRMGSTAFRWAAVASLVITATTFTSVSASMSLVVKVGILAMRCTGSTEICLLALLVLSMKAIGLSPRSRPFGVAVGLGLMAVVDCIESSVSILQLQIGATQQTIFEAAALLSLACWIVYAVMPELVQAPAMIRADSTIYKWDQIACALGHKGTQVALEPAPSFFLVDVEKVVDRAFVRTLKGKQSEV